MADKKQEKPQQPQEPQQAPPTVGAIDLGKLFSLLTSPTVVSTLMYLLTKLQQQNLPQTVGSAPGDGCDCPEGAKKAVDQLVEELSKSK